MDHVATAARLRHQTPRRVVGIFPGLLFGCREIPIANRFRDVVWQALDQLEPFAAQQRARRLRIPIPLEQLLALVGMELH